MADENTNTNGGTQDSADILSQLLNSTKANRSRQEKLLESIDKNLTQLLKNSKNISMSNVSGYDYDYGKNAFNNVFSSRYKFGDKKSNASNSMSDFTDAFEKQLLEGFLGSDFKDKIRGAFDSLASDMGVETKDIAKTFGKYFGDKALGFIKRATDNGNGDDVIASVKKARDSLFKAISDGYNAGVDSWYADPKKNKNGYSRPTINPTTQSASDINENTDSDKQNFDIGSQQGKSKSNKIDNLTYDVEKLVIYAQSVGIQQTDASPPDIGLSVAEMASSVISAMTEVDDKSVSTEKENKVSETSASAPDIGDIIGGLSVGIDIAKMAGITDLAAASAALEGIIRGVSGGLSALASMLGMTVPGMLALAGLAAAAVGTIVIAFEILEKVVKNALQPAIEGTKKAFEAASKAANRYESSRKKNLELAQQRLEEDIRTMVSRPFEILEDAANKWYQTWDNNLRVINGTQGYNKEELQSLMGAFADRLREENLTNVVSASDITDNLVKVLESGLSGTVAEEFAYLATKLNAAVPTQDFFSYADTYASIAANAIRNGKSQSEAIQLANTQLELFASDLLYAGREVAGGFTAGLKNAETLFEQSVQIAQTAKTDNANEIAGVMTAVSAITGAIAPDLANSMTDAIYKAAVGGNSSEIVALRSLAGINASNTEFLKQLSTNPKEVFVNLFNELSKRQNMSSDAYMEVAEGLADIFGVSMDAFARVDFGYLAQAIASMDTSNGALADNIDLLESGETTTNDEMLKMQQINKYILDEGLAYVLDNQAARFIQEHMWQEQLTREITETTYGVELQGAALEFLEGIRQTIDNILGFLNPFKLLGKLANLGATITEARAQKADISELLEAGKIGTGTPQAKFQLTTRNRDLNLTDNIVNMLGGTSMYELASGARKFVNVLANPLTMYGRSYSDMLGWTGAGLSTLGHNEFSSESAYQWNTVGKSLAKQIAAVPSNVSNNLFSSSSSISQISAQASQSDTEKAQEQANTKIKQALDSMSEFVKNDTERTQTYDDWKTFASSKYFKGGNFDEALEGAGMTEEAVKGQFDMLQTQVAVNEKLEREKREEAFWENNTKLLTTTTVWLESINTHAENIFRKFEDYFSEWTKYFIDNAVYNSTFTHEDYDKITRLEKDSSESAIYALADALTQNDVKLLLDPTVQTNALLAQILKVANAILTQTKDSGTALSLPDTIAGLSLGIINS